MLARAGPDTALSRTFAASFRQHGVAALEPLLGLLPKDPPHDDASAMAWAPILMALVSIDHPDARILDASGKKHKKCCLGKDSDGR